MSSFLVNIEGQKLIVTAGHFPQGSRDFEAVFTEPPMRARLTLASHKFDEAGTWDVAALKVNDPPSVEPYNPLSIASDAAFSVGDEVYIAGYPFPDVLQGYYGLTSPMLVVKKGVVGAKIAGRNGKGPLIILDVIWDMGMSGGPVIHARTGKVIGVIASRPLIDGTPIEIVTCPSGDQILRVIREHF